MPPPPLPAAAMTERVASSSPPVPPSRPGNATALGTPILSVPPTSTRPTPSEHGDKPTSPPPPPNRSRQRLREDLSRIQRQDWSRLHVDGPQLDGWYIAKIVLRSISCLLMLTTVAMYIVIILPSQSVISATDYRNKLNAPIASGMHAAFGIFATTTLFWDMAEFITMCCRKGYGITPKAHIGIELTLFLWGAGTVSLVTMLAVAPVWYARYFPTRSGLAGVEEVTSVAVMGGLIVIIRFILFVRNAIDRCGYRGMTPRIMYLQTGEPVVVMRKPYPPPPTRQEPDIEMGDRVTTISAAAAAAANSSASTLVAPRPQPSLWGTTGRRLLLRGKKGPPPVVSSPQPMGPEAEVPERAAVVSSPPHQPRRPREQPEQESEQPPPQDQQHTHSPPSSPPQRQQIPRRRPVPTRNAGDGYDGPVPLPVSAPDYEPDEAERRRAERGEAQAQWMTLEARGIRGPASGKRPGADRQGEEVDEGDLESRYVPA